MKKSIQQHSSAIQTTCRLFKMAPLALAVSLASMAVAPVAQATDLDIYNGVESSGGQTSVMMLFDASQLMAKTDVDGHLAEHLLPAGVDPRTAVPGFTSELGDKDAAYDFPRYYTKSGNKFYYRRVDKVKMGLYHAFDIQRIDGIDSKPINKNLSIGLSVTPNINNSGSNFDGGPSSGPPEDGIRVAGTKGYVLVPAHPLNYRYEGTPVENPEMINEGVNNSSCINSSGSYMAFCKANLPLDPERYAGWTQRDRLHDAIRRLDVNTLTGRYSPLATGFMETSAYLLGNDTTSSWLSGASISAKDSIDPLTNKYIAPAAQGGTCGMAKGVFMLSSGPEHAAVINNSSDFAAYADAVIDRPYRLNPDIDPIYAQDKVRNFLGCNLSRPVRINKYRVDRDGNKHYIGYKSEGVEYKYISYFKTGGTLPYSVPIGDTKQAICGLAMTRVMRGWSSGYYYEPNYVSRNDIGLFGDQYKVIPSLEHKKLNILTGMIAFGGNMELFSEIPKVKRKNHLGQEVSVHDCDSLKIFQADRARGSKASRGIYDNYQNFCMMTEETYGFGEGGLYQGSNPAQISEALNSFISKLGDGDVDIPPMSTGTMSVPFDSLNQLTPRTSAYLPILDPKVGTAQLWPGNLKKYSIKNGTIVGKDNSGEDKKVFTSRQGFFAKDVRDNWNANTTADEAKPQVGGAYQQILKGVISTETKTETRNRKTYIDVGNDLKSISVEAGSPSGFTSLKDAWSNESSINQIAQDSTQQATLKASSDKATDIAKRVQEMMRQLVNFLGYPADSTTTVSDNSILTKLDGDGNPENIQQTRDNRVLGGVLHSRPQLVTYDAVLNKDGSVASRKDYLLYGSFDGALHMVDDDTGEELFNFIPRQVLQRQGKAFSPATNQTLGDPTKAPYLHGVDGEWKVFGDYRRKVTGKDTYGIKADSMFAVGGLRMGGSTYYALDITDKNSPKMLYSVGSDYALGVGKGSFTTTGEKNGSTDSVYNRMGLSWGKPNVAYVKKDGKRVMVSLLPGGYDECYEDPKFKLGSATNSIAGCKGKTSAQGNAIYMVKLAEEEKVDGVSKWKTDGITGIGSALWWASSNVQAFDTTGMKIPDMKHSIVGEVLALDGNYDGLTDHLYFSDLGGQVWRVDINNDINDTETDDFSIQRVVKVFDASDDAENGYSPRMYDTPLVTFQRLGKEGKIHGVVTVGTGDRSNPLDTGFSNNHIYTFIDKDLARYRNELFCKKETDSTDDCMTRYTEDLTPDDLIGISYDDDGAAKDGAKVKTAIDRGISGETSDDGIVAKAGWKYKLDDSGFTAKLNEGKGPDEPKQQPKGLKMLNRPDALSGQLYTSVFSPEFTIQESKDTCAMSIAGLTNRERLCLPYGYCFTKDTDGSSKTVNRSTVVAGGGIVDNYVGYLGQGKTDEKGRPIKTIGILDTYCEGDECERSTEIDELGKLGEFDVNRSFNPLKWFDR